ncbi:MAG: CDGSH iron-sulfur domain-containing protein [Ignavibacterium sp.]|nr:CDGSH iron-sulfur domain-containing protein [Ignavibacterium sp.]
MTKIKIAENGPILIEVNKAIIHKAGAVEEIPRKLIALCRCGQSSNKPFCDGSHKSCGFSGELVEIEIQ